MGLQNRFLVILACLGTLGCWSYAALKGPITLNKMTLMYEFKDVTVGGSTKAGINLVINTTLTGWVGIGIQDQKRKDMIGADYFIGGWDISESKAYGGDYYVPSNGNNTSPKRDSTNHWDFHITGNTTITQVVLNRHLDTGDKEDKVIPKKGAFQLLWASGYNDTYPSYHQTSRGSVCVNLDLEKPTDAKCGATSISLGISTLVGFLLLSLTRM